MFPEFCLDRRTLGRRSNFGGRSLRNPASRRQ
jgi:hypothetical protein